MRVVADELEIFVLESVDVRDLRVEVHLRERAGLAGELKFRLLEVVGVKVEVPESVDELAGLEAADLRGHEREQSVGCDVEGHAEKEIGAALVKLAA